MILDDGRRMGYKTYENVLHLWEGSYLTRTKQAYYDWGVIAAHFEGLRLLGELQDNMKPLPSMEGQQETLALAEEKSSAFSFSQEIMICAAPQKDVPKVLLLPERSPTTDKVTEYLFGRGIDYGIIRSVLLCL